MELDLLDYSHKEVGDIGNYYGGLIIAEIDGKYYWAIENYNGAWATEISKDLYEILNKQ